MWWLNRSIFSVFVVVLWQEDEVWLFLYVFSGFDVGFGQLFSP